MLLIIQKSIRVLHLIAVFSRAKDKCGRTKNKKNRKARPPQTTAKDHQTQQYR